MSQHEKQKIGKKFVIELNYETTMALNELAVQCSLVNKHNGGFTSHGDLTTSSLITMLAEDAAMIITRPGSWEGANMAQVFASHGYGV